MNLFKLAPEDVFTPRSAKVNTRLYVPRPDLEEELSDGLSESQHLVIFGESGNGKSWLYKKVFASEKVTYEVVNLVQASRLGGLQEALQDRLDREEKLEKEQYELATAGGVRPAGVGVDFEGTWTYIKGKKEPFEQLLAYLRKSAGKWGKAVLVFDNFEQIASNKGLCKQVTDCVVLLDDPVYADYKVKIVIVGTPAGIDEIMSKAENAQTISTRLKEIPEVERMSHSEAKTLMKWGLEDQLKLEILGRKEVFYDHFLRITDRIALELQELGLKIAKEAEKKNGVIDQTVMKRAIRKWARNSIKSSCAQVSARLNSRETRAARRNQCIFACGNIEQESFSYRDIESEIRKRFPDSTTGVALNISGELSRLSKGENPLLKRLPNEDAYRLSNPKIRMAIRAMLGIVDGKVVKVLEEV